ncbi:MAG: hypothetical protein JEZ09_09110 [Salinivirgaceae bacterium]|nr:hypothetical protein [Salinivirgaceae bacterium]
MKKTINIILFIIPIVLLFSSCAVTKTQKGMRTTTFMPDRVEMRITLEDFEMVGESTVTVTYNKYLGVIKVLRSINGKEVAKRNVNTIQTYGRSWMPIGAYLERALYDAQLELKDAEIFIPVNIMTETENMFLGSKTKKTMKVRAYKMK